MRTACECKVKLVLVVLGTVLALCLTAFFVCWARGWVGADPIGYERAQLREKNLMELKAANRESLATYGWADEARGIIRLPIGRAMEITVDEWQDPAAGRAQLMQRHQQATVPLDQLYE
jgi:hypothetical protein